MLIAREKVVITLFVGAFAVVGLSGAELICGGRYEPRQVSRHTLCAVKAGTENGSYKLESDGFPCPTGCYQIIGSGWFRCEDAFPSTKLVSGGTWTMTQSTVKCTPLIKYPNSMCMMGGTDFGDCATERVEHADP